MAGSGLQPAVYAITFLFPAVAFIIVSLRFYRRLKERSFALEDILLGAAMAVSIAYTFVFYAFVKEAYYGYHPEDIPTDEIDEVYVNKVKYVYAIIYNPILCLVKASFCLTLMKLRSPRIWVNRCLWAIQIINAGYMIGAVVASIFACVPIKKRWYPDTPGFCYNTAAYVITSICIVIATDIMVVTIPTWMLYDLHMPRIRKLVTVSFLSFGLAVTAIGIARLEFLVRVFVKEQDPKFSVEQTYSSIESNLAIIGACGPTVKWMLGRCIPFFDSTRMNVTYPQYDSTVSRTKQRMSHKYADPTDTDFVMMDHDDFDYPRSPRSPAAMELREGAGSGQNSRSQASGTDDIQSYGTENSGGRQGIMKTVEFNVSSGDTANSSSKYYGSDAQYGVRPTDVV